MTSQRVENCIGKQESSSMLNREQVESHEAQEVLEAQEEPREAQEAQEALQVQPDGGWGWVVCFTAMVSYGSVGTLWAGFSILYVEMLEQYGKGDPNVSSKTAQIGSLFFGVSCIMSPVAGVMSDKIGIRKTAVMGAAIASVGLISSAFVENLVLMYFTFSFLVGVGSGCLYSQSFVILGHYFKKRLGIVSGLYYCGVPLFTVAMTLGLPPMLDAIGLSYTLMAQACMAFVWIPCALTWKPLLHKVEREEVIEMRTDDDEANHLVYEYDTVEQTNVDRTGKEQNNLNDITMADKQNYLHDASEKTGHLCDDHTLEKSDQYHWHDMAEKPSQLYESTTKQTTDDQTETPRLLRDATDGNTRVKTGKARCSNCRTLLDMSIWRNRFYVLWVTSVAIIMFSYFTPLVHVVQFAKITFPDHDGTKLVIWIYVSSGVFRFIGGRLSDFRWVNPVRLSQLALLAMCICYNCLPYTPSFTVLLVLCNAIGASDGVFYCLLGPNTVRLVGEGSTSQGYGFLLGVLSIPATFGPPVGGLLFDRLGNYTVAFHLSGCVPLIGLFLLFFIKLPHRPRTNGH